MRSQLYPFLQEELNYKRRKTLIIKQDHSSFQMAMIEYDIDKIKEDLTHPTISTESVDKISHFLEDPEFMKVFLTAATYSIVQFSENK